MMAEVDLLRPGARVGRAGAPRPSCASSPTRSTTCCDRLEDERRRSAQRALAAQEAERLRVSRELHDGVGPAR